MSREGERKSKHNECSPAPQVWFGSEKTVTFQDGAIQVYTERNLKDGSVKTQYFIRAMNS